MTSDAIISNPIGWAQYKLLGGARRISLLCGCYAGLALFLNVLIYRGVAKPESVPLSAFAGGSLVITLLVQAALLLLVGTGAIKRAVHRDFTTDMIVSHRSTAMTGYTAVLGYLTGATGNALGLSVVNLAACLFLSVLAGYSVAGPLGLFLLMGCLSALIWTLSVLVALSTRGTTSVTGLVVVLTIASGMSLPSIYPGLALLLGQLNYSMVSSTAASGLIDNWMIVSMISQVVVAMIFFAAAARKYARDDVLAFSAQLAFTLLAVMTLISAVALRFQPIAPPGRTAPLVFFAPSVHLVSTLIALALIAILPVANAAKSSAGWSRRRARDANHSSPKPRPFAEAPIIATILVGAILSAVCGPAIKQTLGDADGGFTMNTIAVVLAFFFTLLALSGLLRAAYAVTHKAGWLVLFFVILTWMTPPLIDLALEVIDDRLADVPRSWLFASSPVGSWIIAATNARGPLLPGLIVQGSVAACGLFLARRQRL